MKKNIIITLLAATVLSSCGEYNKLLKSTDYEYKYEAAKNYFAKGQYNRSATLLNELITILKGGDKAEESLYMFFFCDEYPGAEWHFAFPEAFLACDTKGFLRTGTDRNHFRRISA